jgi:hypothetical protein
MINTRVAGVSPLPDHVLLVTFDNGEQRRLDVRPYLSYAVFERLRDAAMFSLARADHGTVVWPGGIDLDPDSVYLDSVPTTQAAAV